jgi:hypothetical protein
MCQVRIFFHWMEIMELTGTVICSSRLPKQLRPRLEAWVLAWIGPQTTCIMGRIPRWGELPRSVQICIWLLEYCCGWGVNTHQTTCARKIPTRAVEKKTPSSHRVASSLSCATSSTPPVPLRPRPPPRRCTTTDRLLAVSCPSSSAPRQPSSPLSYVRRRRR